MKSNKAMQLTRHYESLARLAQSTNPDYFKNPNSFEVGQSLYKRLRRVELLANRAACDYCNIPNYDWEKAKDGIISRVTRIFGGTLPNGFFVNGDPRGYALKIDTENYESGYKMSLALYQDWGGYGILAPEF